MSQRYRRVPTGASNTPRRPRGQRPPDTRLDVPQQTPPTGPAPRLPREARVDIADSPLSLRDTASDGIESPLLSGKRSRRTLGTEVAIPEPQFSKGPSAPESVESSGAASSGMASPTSVNYNPRLDPSGQRKRSVNVRESLAPRKGQVVVLHPMQAEPDDYLHIPDKNPNARSMRPSWRGVINVLTLVVIGLGLLMLFAGYPIIANIDHLMGRVDPNRKGQVHMDIPQMPARPLVDPDTQDSDKMRTNPLDQSKWDLVFSDEFEQDGRTFWPGDDPYWEAVDIWYKATNDYEWYTPEAVRTEGGKLVITLDNVPEHDLNFRSGMLQSWNKFCFQGGYIEAAAVLPGGPATQGYWPGFWTLGNLARPGYLASTEGMWPYVYSESDVGVLPNQTFLDGSGPEAALHVTDNGKGRLSSLPGMRFPKGTCKGQGHPGPSTSVARSAPEIDVFEVQVQGSGSKKGSYASQSFQIAPFDHNYMWGQNDSSFKIYDKDVTKQNTWRGGPLQEAVSSVTRVPESAFMETENKPCVFGLEYDPDWNGDGSGHITFFVDGKPSWTVYGSAFGPDTKADIGQRVISTEPMSIIMNLGVRWTVVQAHSADLFRFPKRRDHPTSKYINDNPELYYNNNLTEFDRAKWPKNEKLTGC
ncbi:hypothetical protein MSPP1_001058 [Malassezia sp. CBS 17886]|nr:hypothetical protein MSPP1_001058 [Malassezia sp. CBS 17886]